MQITRAQAVDLLESLTEFLPLPRVGFDLASTISSNARRAQIEAERRFSTALTMDDSGVKALSHLLSALHQAMRPSMPARLFGARISFPSAVLVANVFGAFLGETLRTHAGGEWRLVELNQRTLVALCSEQGNYSLPTYKAGKHFINGEQDDVSIFYRLTLLKLAPSKVPPILTISTDDLANPADYARKWEQVFKNARSAGS